MREENDRQKNSKALATMDSTDYMSMWTSSEMLDGQHQTSCGETGEVLCRTPSVQNCSSTDKNGDNSLMIGPRPMWIVV